MSIEEQTPSSKVSDTRIFRHSYIRGRNDNLALESSGWEAFFPMFECASKSYKVNGVFNIMDVVDLVCLCIFNMWFSSSNSSRSS